MFIFKKIPIAIFSVLWLVYAQPMQESKELFYALPVPTGKYAVGKTQHVINDLARLDAEGAMPINMSIENNKKKVITKENCRQLTVHLWYPATGNLELSSDCFELEFVMNSILGQKVNFDIGTPTDKSMPLLKKSIIQFFDKHLAS